MELRELYRRLLEQHGKQGWWPLINNETLKCEYTGKPPCNEEQRFEICLGAILTQNTNWHPNVVKSLQQLKLRRKITKKEFETIQNTKQRYYTSSILPETLLKMEDDEIATLIKSAGFFNDKTKKLKEFSKRYKEICKEPTRQNLLSIWGIGKETADSILLYAFNKPRFIVDAYAKRVLKGRRIINGDESYDSIKDYVERELPEETELHKEFHALLVEEGKKKKYKQHNIF